jgi:hypothetical protein
MQALVTLVVGRDYTARFERHCRQAWSAYARRHGYDLVVFDTPLDYSARARSRPIYWQKNLILEQEAVAKYRQIALLDSDVAINVETAPPIFEDIAEDRVGAVDEYRVPDAATYRRALAASYLRARRLGHPFLHNLTPEQFYRNRGLPEFGEVVQGGVVVCSPRHHREVFRRVYGYEDTPIPTPTYEMAALSCELLSRQLVTWIDYRFNRLALLGIAEHLPFWSTDQGGCRSPADAQAVSAIIARLFAGCYFLHFAGCHPLMDHLQHGHDTRGD